MYLMIFINIFLLSFVSVHSQVTVVQEKVYTKSDCPELPKNEGVWLQLYQKDDIDNLELEAFKSSNFDSATYKARTYHQEEKFQKVDDWDFHMLSVSVKKITNNPLVSIRLYDHLKSNSYTNNIGQNEYTLTCVYSKNIEQQSHGSILLKKKVYHHHCVEDFEGDRVVKCFDKNTKNIKQQTRKKRSINYRFK